MISSLKSLYKIWTLKREINSIEHEVDEYYLTLMSRNEEFQNKIDIEKLYQKFVKIRNIEKLELKRQIDKLRK